MDTLSTNDRGFAHTRQRIQHVFHVLGKHVQPLRCDDHLLLSATDGEVAGFVQISNIPGMKPAFCECGCRLRASLVIARRHTLTAHENLTVRGKLDFDARDRLANRSHLYGKGIVESNDW